MRLSTSTNIMNFDHGKPYMVSFEHAVSTCAAAGYRYLDVNLCGMSRAGKRFAPMTEDNWEEQAVIENPGSIRTGKKQMLRGGISDPRNKTLMKMFNMIGIGERAGSGIPDIYQVWENEGWPMPVVEESYNPDRTRLSLEFAKKQTIKTSEEEKEPKRSQKGAEKEPIKGAERKKEILKLIKLNSTITQVEIMKELDLTRKQVQKDMKELQEMHIIAREGTNRRGRWIIVKENK